MSGVGGGVGPGGTGAPGQGGGKKPGTGSTGVGGAQPVGGAGTGTAAGTSTGGTTGGRPGGGTEAGATTAPAGTTGRTGTTAGTAPGPTGVGAGTPAAGATGGTTATTPGPAAGYTPTTYAREAPNSLASEAAKTLDPLPWEPAEAPVRADIEQPTYEAPEPAYEAAEPVYEAPARQAEVARPTEPARATEVARATELARQPEPGRPAEAPARPSSEPPRSAPEPARPAAASPASLPPAPARPATGPLPAAPSTTPAAAQHASATPQQAAKPQQQAASPQQQPANPQQRPASPQQRPASPQPAGPAPVPGKLGPALPALDAAKPLPPADAAALEALLTDPEAIAAVPGKHLCAPALVTKLLAEQRPETLQALAAALAAGKPFALPDGRQATLSPKNLAWIEAQPWTGPQKLQAKLQAGLMEAALGAGRYDLAADHPLDADGRPLPPGLHVEDAQALAGLLGARVLDPRHVAGALDEAYAKLEQQRAFRPTDELMAELLAQELAREMATGQSGLMVLVEAILQGEEGVVADLAKSSHLFMVVGLDEAVNTVTVIDARGKKRTVDRTRFAEAMKKGEVPEDLAGIGSPSGSGF